LASATDADKALRDLRDVVVRSTIWTSLAYADIRSRYRLSTFGSLWITLTTGALALAIGLFYGQFFGQDMHSYLPYFTARGHDTIGLLKPEILVREKKIPE